MQHLKYFVHSTFIVQEIRGKINSNCLPSKDQMIVKFTLKDPPHNCGNWFTSPDRLQKPRTNPHPRPEMALTCVYPTLSLSNTM